MHVASHTLSISSSSSSLHFSYYSRNYGFEEAPHILLEFVPNKLLLIELLIKMWLLSLLPIWKEVKRGLK